MGQGGAFETMLSATESELPDGPYRSLLSTISVPADERDMLSSAERTATAHLVRAPGYQRSTVLGPGEIAWVRQIADDPGGVGSLLARSPEVRDVSPARLAELLKLTALVCSIDTYCFAVGTVSSVPLDGRLELASSLGPLDPLRGAYVGTLVSYLNESLDDLTVCAEHVRRCDDAGVLDPDALRLSRVVNATVGVPRETLIADFVRAAHGRQSRRIVPARVELVTVCGAPFSQAVAAVVGAFELLNRLSLGLGSGLVPEPSQEQLAPLQQQLDAPNRAPSPAGLRELGFGADDLESLALRS